MKEQQIFQDIRYLHSLRKFFLKLKPAHVKELDDILGSPKDKRYPNLIQITQEQGVKLDSIGKEYHEFVPVDGCFACYDSPLSAFNARVPEYANCMRYLRRVRQIKLGELFKCIKCHQEWFLDSDGEMMEKIPKSQGCIFHEWARKKLVLSDSIWAKIKKIGANPVHLNGRAYDEVQVPCRCLNKNGTWLDFCLLSFQKKLGAYDLQNKKFLYCDQVVDIAESEYALNKTVRTAIHEARELSADFAPSPVQTRDRERFVVLRGTSFFSYKGCKGKNLIPAMPQQKWTSSQDYKKWADKIHYDPKKVTLVICDWDERCPSLRLLQSGEIEG